MIRFDNSQPNSFSARSLGSNEPAAGELIHACNESSIFFYVPMFALSPIYMINLTDYLLHNGVGTFNRATERFPNHQDMQPDA